MASFDKSWDDLSRNIQDIVDRAVNSQDYQKLNQTIRQAVDKATDIGSSAVRRAVDSDAARRSASSRRSSERTGTRPASTAAKSPEFYGSTGSLSAAGVCKIAGGSVLALLAAAGLAGFLVLNWLFGGAGPLLLPCSFLGFGCGVWLIVSGALRLRWLGRFRTYRKILGDKTHCGLEKLGRGTGRNMKQLRRELKAMIDKGLFREGHLNKEQTVLIVSDEAYRYFEQSRLQLEERQRQEAAAAAKMSSFSSDPRIREVMERGNAFIAEIRDCNDAIPGLEISEKISRMETLVRRIFQRAGEHPELIPDLKKLMDYYLPMTVKLLRAYADMDAQPVQGDNILAAKREIEQTLDTLNTAYEKLLDDLFADTALDVSSDISVLQTLLAQEGLTEDGLSKTQNK